VVLMPMMKSKTPTARSSLLRRAITQSLATSGAKVAVILA
jgi:hypothetical protein